MENQPVAEAPQAPSGTDLFDPRKPTGLPIGQDPATTRVMGEEEVSPEEQAEYDQIVRAAATLIYKNPRKTLESMNFDDLPVHQAVGRTAAKIGEAVEASAAAAGKKLNPDVIWHAGSEVIEMLMDLGTQSKVFTLDPEGEEYQQEAAMALMEAEKLLGEKALRDPKKAAKLSAEASDAWAWNIAKEVDGGQASPEYTKMVDAHRQANDPITAGVRRALGPQQ